MRNSAVRDIAYIAVFAALIVVFAFVAIPASALGIPIVLQNAIIILTGLVLGGKRGVATSLLFLLLGLIGLPVLAGGRQLLPALAGPTAGYIVGYIISPAVAGFIAYLPAATRALRLTYLAIGGLLALLTQYACGVVGLVLVSKLSWAAALSAQVPFLGPDTAKVAIMVAIASAVHSAFPALIRKK